MKARFEIKWPDDNGESWMNVWNLLACLTSKCPNTRFVVTDLDNGNTAEGQHNEEKEVF